MTHRVAAARLTLLCFLCASTPEQLPGQQRMLQEWNVAGAAPGMQESAGGIPPVWQPAAASLLVPGAGQLLSGQRRGWVYLAVEALVWTGFAVERSRGLDDRRAYRDLAWTVARGGTGQRVDGDFNYYERMGRWSRSGSFDRDPAAPGVQPETDPATFNGDAWRLASAIFLGGGPPDPGAPGYENAVAYYRDRAYGDAFLWDWTAALDSQDRFRDLIDDSDGHLRNATLILGGAVANRVFSTLDVLLSRRVGRETSLRLVPETGPGRSGSRALFTLRVVLP